MAAVSELHFQQVQQLGAVLKFLGHVVMENTYATFTFDLPQRFKLRPERPRIKWFLRGKALLFTFEAIAAQFAEVALEQVAVDQGIAVVERQRQPPFGAVS